MSQKNSGGISLANILAMIGLAGIGVITFFGILLHSPDGKPAGAILGAIGLVAALGLLLYFCIRAKSADESLGLWRYVEYGCLIVYVFVAIIFAGPFQRFFYISFEKEKLQDQARTEIKAIKNLYLEYDHQRTSALNTAVEQMKSYKTSAQSDSVDTPLASYMDVVGNNIDSWRQKADVVTKLPEDTEIADIEDRIEGWNIMQIPATAKELEEKSPAAWNTVQNKIETAQRKNNMIPVIEGGGYQPYRLSPNYAQYSLTPLPEPKFAAMVRESNGNTVIGWIIYVLLNFLVLLNYFVAPRTDYVGPRRRKSSLGGGSNL